MIIQKSVKGNSVVVVNREDYLKKMHNNLSDQKKFTIVNLKDETLLNLAVNQEKHVDKVVKELVESNSRTEKNWYLLKSVGSGSSVMYSLCKVHKAKRRELPVISTNFVGFEHSYLQNCEILGANFKTFGN